MAWARECLASGDAPEEIALALDLSEEQLLCAAGVRKPMNARQREAAAQYAAGVTLAAIAAAMGLTRTARVSALLETARSYGYAIPKRVQRMRHAAATSSQWVEGARSTLRSSALGAAAETARAAL